MTVCAMVNRAQILGPTGTEAEVSKVSQIEIGIPLPRSRREWTRQVRANVQSMQLGESFCTVLDATTVRRIAKESDVKLTARKLTDGRRRFWRIK